MVKQRYATAVKRWCSSGETVVRAEGRASNRQALASDCKGGGEGLAGGNLRAFAALRPPPSSSDGSYQEGTVPLKGNMIDHFSA